MQLQLVVKVKGSWAFSHMLWLQSRLWV